MMSSSFSRCSRRTIRGQADAENARLDLLPTRDPGLGAKVAAIRPRLDRGLLISREDHVVGVQ
jgi:hypothetical protein